MSRVEVKKVPETANRALPIFEEFERVADEIRAQAYNLFKHRGASDGHALDDWLAAERELGWPAAELAEANGGYSLKVALAGFDSGEIEVTATPCEIMIKAAHEQENKSSKDDTRTAWTEFRRNDVYRRVEMPTPIDVDGIAASLKNGMLAITAPKAKDGKKEAPRKVKLSTPS